MSFPYDRKLIFIDTETTGLDPVKHDVWQIAGIIACPGIAPEPFVHQVRPTDPKSYELKALEMHNLTVDELRSMPDPAGVRSGLEILFANYVDKFSRHDKFTIVGYNVGFDKDFLFHFWRKTGSKYFHSWFEYYVVDVYHLVQLLRGLNLVPPQLPKLTLAPVYKWVFGKELEGAHDASADVAAAMALFNQLTKFINPRLSIIPTQNSEEPNGKSEPEKGTG
jgi:DNA polymerase III epsilon subunit-like protein